MANSVHADTELIHTAQQGDPDAFAELVGKYGKYVYNLAYGLTGGNHAEAEDLAQMTFVRAYRALKRFEGRSEFRTWLHRITVNLWKNMVRSQIRRKYFQHRSLQASLPDGERKLSQIIPEKGPSPMQRVEGEETLGIIRAAVDQLPPDEKAVTVLRDLEGLSYEEIAKICRIPLGTVKSRIARARRMLRSKLEPILRGS